jgi:hypothetical protein
VEGRKWILHLGVVGVRQFFDSKTGSTTFFTDSSDQRLLMLNIDVGRDTNRQTENATI